MDRRNKEVNHETIQLVELTPDDAEVADVLERHVHVPLSPAPVQNSLSGSEYVRVADSSDPAQEAAEVGTHVLQLGEIPQLLGQ